MFKQLRVYFILLFIGLITSGILGYFYYNEINLNKKLTKDAKSSKTALETEKTTNDTLNANIKKLSEFMSKHPKKFFPFTEKGENVNIYADNIKEYLYSNNLDGSVSLTNGTTQQITSMLYSLDGSLTLSYINTKEIQNIVFYLLDQYMTSISKIESTPEKVTINFTIYGIKK